MQDFSHWAEFKPGAHGIHSLGFKELWLSWNCKIVNRYKGTMVSQKCTSPPPPNRIPRQIPGPVNVTSYGKRCDWVKDLERRSLFWMTQKGPKSMTSVHVRDTQRTAIERRRRQCDPGSRDWSIKAHKLRNAYSYQKPWRQALSRHPPKPGGKAALLAWHPDLNLWLSEMWKNTFVVLSTSVVIFYGSHRELIQVYFSKVRAHNFHQILKEVLMNSKR